MAPYIFFLKKNIYNIFNLTPLKKIMVPPMAASEILSRVFLDKLEQ